MPSEQPKMVHISKLLPLPGGKQMPLFRLPPEIITLVADNLDTTGLLSLRVCSKALYDLTMQPYYRAKAMHIHRDAKSGLESAASKGMVDLVEKMVRAGADTSVASSMDFTPLHRAADQGHEGVVRVLLKSGTDASLRSRRGDTALHRAAQGGHLECVKLLVEYGADVTARNGSDESAADLAGWRKRYDVVDLFRDRGSYVRLTKKLQGTLLHDAARYGLVTEMRECLESGNGDVTSRDVRGNTPLHLAAQSGRVEAVEFLVDAGADLMAPGENGKTPLHSANSNSPPVVKALLDRGADVNYRDESGITPMIAVCRNNARVDVVRLFIEAGVDLDEQSRPGHTEDACASVLFSGRAATEVEELLVAAGFRCDGHTHSDSASSTSS